MHKTLSILIVLGLVIWGFLAVATYHPEKIPGFSFSATGKVDNANTTARCAQYGKDVEGDRDMDYRDRVKQVLAGCW